MPTTKIPVKKLQIPNNLGELADLYNRTRDERLALDHLVDEKKAHETALRAALIEGLKRAKLSVVGGKTVRATISTKLVPQVEDWPSFYAHVAKKKAFDLLQRRISTTAVVERWDSGENVPGVKAVQVDDLSINKL